MGKHCMSTCLSVYSLCNKEAITVPRENKEHCHPGYTESCLLFQSTMQLYPNNIKYSQPNTKDFLSRAVQNFRAYDSSNSLSKSFRMLSKQPKSELSFSINNEHK